MAKIPDPFVIYYRPPGDEDHQKLNKVLDGLHDRLNNLEDFLAGEECQELPESEIL